MTGVIFSDRVQSAATELRLVFAERNHRRLPVSDRSGP